MSRTLGSSLKSALFAEVAGLLLWASIGVAQAQIIIQHSGSTDPTTEGWTKDLGIGVVEGPVTADLGFDAWSIDDPTTAENSTRLYTFIPSAAVVNTALTNGWRLTARLRVVDTPDNVDRAIMAEFIDGTRRWRMDFGSQPDGDPIVLLQTGVSGAGDDTGVLFALEGGGSGYHLYQMVFDPCSRTVDLFVDGVERVSNFTGMATGITRVAFGSGQANQVGHGNWSLVQFEVVPAVGQLPFQHSGANDPTSEGWACVPGNGPQVPTVGPVFNDLGSGHDAWMVNDTGTSLGDLLFYRAIPTETDVENGWANGWRLSAFIRHAGPFPDPPIGHPALSFDGSPFISYRDGTTSYQILFGAQADGDPIVWLSTAFAPNPSGHEIVLDGAGPGYHLYEMVFDPSEGDVDVFIDGVERFNNFGGAPLVQTGVLWGSGSSCCIGQGNFNLVRFDVGAGNQPPVAVDDEATVAEGQTEVIDVLANDFDPDGDDISIGSTTHGQFGTVEIVDQKINYSANVLGALIDRIEALPLNARLINSLRVKLQAAKASFVRGNRQAGLNQLAALVNQLEPLVRSGQLDPDLAGVIIAIVQLIQGGAVTDSFTYTISDPDGETDSATVTVTGIFF